MREIRKKKADRKKLRQQSIEYSPSILSSINYPIFCFHYIANNKYSLANCNRDERAACMNTMRILSQFSWQYIESNHVKGCHIIKDKDSISVTKPEPAPMSPDLPIIAFEFGKDKKMVGYRRECVFHIIWLDRDFSLYPHGS